MYYNDNGEIKPINVKASDTLPIGTIVEYDGADIPSGWESIGNNKIKKIETSVGIVGKITNLFSSSNKDTYSCEYINNINDYSTEEKVVGTFNGKPLYRKLFIKNMASGTSIDFAIDTIHDENYYDYMSISSKSCIKLSKSTSIKFQPLNIISNNTTSAYYTRANIQYANQWQVYIQGNDEVHVNGTIYLVLEYTKTND